jgi:predicted RNA-binding Zn-ribbon protein involved in translation (DUF1610 family)
MAPKNVSRQFAAKIQASDVRPGMAVFHPTFGPCQVTWVDDQNVLIRIDRGKKAGVTASRLQPDTPALRTAWQAMLGENEARKAVGVRKRVQPAPGAILKSGNGPKKRPMLESRVQKMGSADVRCCDSCGSPIPKARLRSTNVRFCCDECGVTFRRNDRHTIQPDWS